MYSPFVPTESLGSSINDSSNGADCVIDSTCELLQADDRVANKKTMGKTNVFFISAVNSLFVGRPFCHLKYKKRRAMLRLLSSVFYDLAVSGLY